MHVNKSRSLIIGASLIAAASSFLATVVSSRTLTPADNKAFLVYWSLLFGIFGVISGIQTESTRTVLSKSHLVIDERRLPRPLSTAIVLGALTAATLTATSVMWIGRLHLSQEALSLILLALGSILYSGQAALSGIAAGGKRWSTFALLMSAEAVMRLALIAVVGGVWATPLALAVAATVPAGTWLALLTNPNIRDLARARADVPITQLMRNMLHSMISTAAWALMVTGFPTILAATSQDTHPRALSLIILTMSIVRTPIMLPLQAFQGMFITTIQESSPLRRKLLITRTSGLIVLVGLILATAAALAGPLIMAMIYGTQYQPSGMFIFLATLASVSIALLVLSGSCAIAIGRHRSYSEGWTVSLLVFVAALTLLPLSAEARSLISLGISPLIGYAWHLISLHKNSVAIDRS